MSKIIIFSEDNDSSTSKIMKWIFSEGIQVERINMDDPALNKENFGNEFGITKKYRNEKTRLEKILHHESETAKTKNKEKQE